MTLPESVDGGAPSGAVPFVEVLPTARVEGTVTPPGSKSLTNRGLLCAAFASGESVLRGVLHSEDTEVMIDALRQIGVSVGCSDAGTQLRITGRRASAPSPSDELNLYVANSGTTIRFLAAALSAAGGKYRLSGVPRMHQRPIGDLVEAITAVLEGEIRCDSPGGCPPVMIQSTGWKRFDVEVGGAVSSQYLSGLMMAAPIALRSRHDTIARIRVVGELVSRPYVEMTASVMQTFGADVTIIDHPPGGDSSLEVEISGNYVGCEYKIEPDASAASYFWAAAAITAGSVTVDGLGANALQGDVGFCQVLESMGCVVEHSPNSIAVHGKPLVGVDVDMNAISDTVQTLSVVALFADGPTRIRGIAHNRFKETDRIADLARELRKLGASVQEHEDGLTINPPAKTHGATLDTYGDHRMAMSLSLAGLRIAGVKILDPACTSKTYPNFFADLERLIGRAHRWG